MTATVAVAKDEALIDRYEEMRRTFFSQPQRVMAWGFVVLRTKGMAAWARTWQKHGKGGIESRPSEPAATSSHLPPDAAEVIRVLAAMVGAIQEEQFADA